MIERRRALTALPHRLRLLLLAVTVAAVLTVVHGALGAWIPDGTPLCTESHGQSMLSHGIVPDGAGGAIVIWTDNRFGESDIYAQDISAGGVPLWSVGGAPICTISGDQSNAVAVTDIAGGAVLFWQDNRTTGHWAIYGQRIDSQGVPQWGAGGLVLATSATGSSGDEHITPMAISDGSTGAQDVPGFIVAWTDQPIGFPQYQFQSVQHVDRTGGTMRTPASTGGVHLGGSSVSRSWPAIATDGTGAAFRARGVYIVWGEGHAGGDDIYARRVNSAGGLQWLAGGVPVCAAPGVQSHPAIAFVGAGSAIIAWHDGRLPDGDLYAQKMNNAGTMLWLADGLPVCRASGSQDAPALMSDGAGGAFAVWSDARSGVPRIFAQRIDANGQPLWPVDGIPLGGVVGTQWSPAIVSDGSGGAIIAWSDQANLPNLQNDIYVQHVDALGNLLWDPIGIPLSRDAGNQALPALARDGGFGAIAAWGDSRNGNADIYADHIAGSGVPTAAPAAVGPPPSCLEVELLSSNPARGPVQFAIDLAEPEPVSVDVLDVRGRRIRALSAPEVLGTGRHVLSWDAKDDAGTPVATGLYYVRTHAGPAMRVARVVRMR